MGSRKISFEPAARDFAEPGLIVMYVSLCGPHSFETSTLLPTVIEDPDPPPGDAAFCDKYWYFAHQVGLCVDEFCAQSWQEKTRQAVVMKKILELHFMDDLLTSSLRGCSCAASF